MNTDNEKIGKSGNSKPNSIQVDTFDGNCAHPEGSISKIKEDVVAIQTRIRTQFHTEVVFLYEEDFPDNFRLAIPTNVSNEKREGILYDIHDAREENGTRFWFDPESGIADDKKGDNNDDDGNDDDNNEDPPSPFEPPSDSSPPSNNVILAL